MKLKYESTYIQIQRIHLLCKARFTCTALASVHHQFQESNLTERLKIFLEREVLILLSKIIIWWVTHQLCMDICTCVYIYGNYFQSFNYPHLCLMICSLYILNTSQLRCKNDLTLTGRIILVREKRCSVSWSPREVICFLGFRFVFLEVTNKSWIKAISARRINFSSHAH